MKKKLNIVQNSSDISNCVIIALIVILFSIASLNFEILVLDDLAFYKEVVEGKSRLGHLNRTLINPFIRHFFVHIMAYSPLLSRFLILTLVMTPLSIISYYVYRKLLLLPKTIAFFSALLPQILPSQVFIPLFVVGSYNTWGLMIYFIAIIFCIKYLTTSKMNYFFLAILFYFISVEITEMAVFLSVPLTVLALGIGKFKKNQVALISGIFIIAIYKTIYAILFKQAASTPQSNSLDVLIERFYKTLTWTLPNPGLGNDKSVIVLFIFILLFGAIFILIKPINLSNPSDKQEKYRFLLWPDRVRWIWYYIFATSWFFASLFPFTKSKYFSSRYVFIPGFGMNLMLVLGIYSFLHRGKLRKFHCAASVLLIFALLVGFARNTKIKKRYLPIERIHQLVKTNLHNFNFPENSQIVIVGSKAGYLFTGGYWLWSTGYLQYATHRDDIKGLVGKEQKFYNPFVPEKRSYSYKMQGLDFNKPLFLFKIVRDKLIQFEYCLQWKEKNDDVEWNIYHVDLTSGNLSVLINGRGTSEYETTIKEMDKKGMPVKKILWADQGK